MSDSKSIHQLPVSHLQPNPLQPRGMIQPETIMDLVDSIKEHGILEPLVVAHTPAGYQIIAGERRWRASKIVGLTEVPCIIKETSPKQMLEMAIVENVQREDLNPIDRAKAFQRLSVEFGLTNSQVAKQIGKSAPYVSNTLKLLELPDAITDGLLTGMITEGHARALQMIQDKKRMLEAYKQILVESASVRRAEEIARDQKFEILKNQGQTTNYATRNYNPKTIVISKEIKEMGENLQKNIGGKAKVKLTRSDKLTRLIISLPGTLAETETTLNRIYQGIALNQTK